VRLDDLAHFLNHQLQHFRVGEAKLRIGGGAPAVDKREVFRMILEIVFRADELVERVHEWLETDVAAVCGIQPVLAVATVTHRPIGIKRIRAVWIAIFQSRLLHRVVGGPGEGGAAGNVADLAGVPAAT